MEGAETGSCVAITWLQLGVRFSWSRARWVFDVGKIKSSFFVDSHKKECQIPDAFHLIIFLFLAKLSHFKNLEYTYNYIKRADFNHDSPKINFKIYNL